MFVFARESMYNTYFHHGIRLRCIFLPTRWVGNASIFECLPEPEPYSSEPLPIWLTTANKMSRPRLPRRLPGAQPSSAGISFSLPIVDHSPVCSSFRSALGCIRVLRKSRRRKIYTSKRLRPHPIRSGLIGILMLFDIFVSVASYHLIVQGNEQARWSYQVLLWRTAKDDGKMILILKTQYC